MRGSARECHVRACALVCVCVRKLDSHMYMHALQRWQLDEQWHHAFSLAEAEPAELRGVVGATQRALWWCWVLAASSRSIGSMCMKKLVNERGRQGTARYIVSRMCVRVP